MIDVAKFESKYVEKIAEHAPFSQLISERKASDVKFDDADLQAIQQNFYDLMHYRCRNAEDCIKWLDSDEADLPKITNDLLSKNEPEWFPVSGMYGGFSYGLIDRDGKPVLITDSWVRIVGGSGQTHEITPTEVTITAEGYV